MYKDHEATSKRQEVKENFQRSTIDQRKRFAIKETETIDALFDVGRLTGLVDMAKELWKAYFAAGVMRKTAHIKDMSETQLMIASKVPILGYIYRYIHFYGQCGDIAWSELNEKAKEIEKEYRKWVEMRIVTTISLKTMGRDEVDDLIHNEQAMGEHINELKRLGVWEEAIAIVEQTYGSIPNIRTSANLLSTIYVQAEDKSSQALQDHLMSACEKYMPPQILKKKKERLTRHQEDK